MPRVALIAFAAAIMACQPASTPAPSVVATAEPTGTPAVAPSDAPSARPTGPVVTELGRTLSDLGPGLYTRSSFRPRITLALEGGTWRVINVLGGFFDIQHEPDTPDVIAVQFARPEGIYASGGTPEVPADAADAVELLRANPDLTIVESSESRMDGRVGSQVTVENPATGTGTASIMEVDVGAVGIDPGRRLWIAFFDTEDGLLAIMVGGSVAKWDEALLLAEPVLESVTIGR